jgi:hypothetical protein
MWTWNFEKNLVLCAFWTISSIFYF